MFNARVKEGDVADVCRSMDGKGNLKFYSRAALYVRLSDKSTTINEGKVWLGDKQKLVWLTNINIFFNVLNKRKFCAIHKLSDF